MKTKDSEASASSVAAIAARGAKPVAELLGWANAIKPGSVHSSEWRTRDDADLTLLELCEKETADSEGESAEVASFHGCGQEASARLCAAAPDLYEAARRAMGYLRYSSLSGAAEIRTGLAAALAKAGGAK